MKRIMLALAALLVLPVLAGCATQTTVPQATAAFCTSLGTLDQAVASLNALGASATIGQVKEAQTGVDQAWNATAAAAASVQNAKVDELQAAQQDLKQTVNSIPDSATLDEAKATVAPKALAVTNAIKSLRTTVKCP
ncbi:MAG: hypothetical protein HGA45_30465 [Chloroflexales bacterium]|nr:hypothetical protein [Chloroflexales bacterium]